MTRFYIQKHSGAVLLGSKNLKVISIKSSENITLTNIHLKVMGGKTIAESSFTPNATEYTRESMFGKVLPAGGLFVKGAKNVLLQNVTVETINRDERPEIIME